MDASRDANRITTLLGVSNVDGTTPVTVYADPVTHRLLVDIPGGSGTVTSVSVATANGFAGTVANATTTPAITLTTTVTGILYGNGTSVAAAIAANFPTLNQDTTGTAAITNALKSATTTVNVSSATAPTVGQVLTATSGTAATWQNPTTGFTNPMTTLGDIIYENATPTPARLAGNTTTTKQYLSQTGTGTVSAAPVWAQIAAADLSNGTTGTGAIVLASTPTLTTPVFTGLPTGTGVASAATASTLVARDANGNIYINNHFASLNSVVSAGGTTVLTIASARNQVLTGSGSQVFQLPDATTLTLSHVFTFNNNSSSSLIITNAGGTTQYTVPAGGYVEAFVTNTGTANGSWDFHSLPPGTVTWGSGTTGLVFNTALTTTPAISAGTSSAANPSFIPQRGSATTGYGGDSTHLYGSIGGAATFTSTATTFSIASGSTYQIGGTQIAASNLSNGTTGSGAVVLATSPTLTTPTLGAATATSINKVAITAPATSATLTIADGKTLTVSNTLTFTGTDTSSIAFGTGGTVTYTSNNLSVFAATTSAQLAGVISDETGTGSLVFGTSPTFTTTITTPAITAATNTSINMNAGSYNTIQTYTPAAAGTATLDLSKGNIHHITMPAGNITVALSNATTGQCFIVRILQDATGSRTVTWFSTIKWAGGTAPTLTTTASKADTFGFEVTGTGTYDGFVVGQNI